MKKIFLAALNKDFDTLLEYLKSGNVNIVDERGQSLLHYACRGNAVDIATLLLEHYINPNIADEKGETPLFIATQFNKIGLIKLLIRNGAEVTVKNKVGETLFFRAIANGNLEVISLFWDTVDSNIENKDGETVAFIAVKYHHLPILKQFVQSHREILWKRNKHGDTLLHCAARCNDAEIVRYLLEEGLSVHAKNHEQATAIFLAARYADYEVCRLLIEHHAILEGKNRFGEDILDIAEWNPYGLVVFFDEVLHTYDYKHYLTYFPFHVAVISQNYNKILEMKKQDIEKSDDKGMTPLDYALIIEDQEIIRLLNKLKG